MQYRLPFVFALASLGAAGAFAAACSTTPVVLQPDADSSVTDGGNGGPDTSAGDSAKMDSSKPVPPCTTNGLQGSCDVVSQNCPAGQECTVLSYADGGSSMECQPAGTGAITEGDTCTPSASSNPCVVGLVCINNRCSRPCCPSAAGAASGDSTICGSSKPEGYPGVCDLQISDNSGKGLYMVCEYNQPCEPFGINPCPSSNDECIVRDTSGTATCQNIYMPPGIASGGDCTFANACQVGMLCAGGPPSKCHYFCYHAAASTPPFDAGALQLTVAGKGGCPGSTTCPAGTVTNLPDWLGLCP